MAQWMNLLLGITVSLTRCTYFSKMHWHVYNNTVPLLNIVKTQIFHLVYHIHQIIQGEKLLRFSQIFANCECFTIENFP